MYLSSNNPLFALLKFEILLIKTQYYRSGNTQQLHGNNDAVETPHSKEVISNNK